MGIEEEDRWYKDEVLHGRSALEAGLELLAQLQRAHGFALRVLVLPTFRVPFDEYDQMEFHESVRDAAKRFPELPVIDLLEGFASQGDDPESLSDDGLHMSAKGHQAMAELLLPVILQIASEAEPHQ